MMTHRPIFLTHTIPFHATSYIAVSGNKMTITNIILTNQRRSYKSDLQHLQQKLDKIDMSYHLRRCVIISGGASE